MTISEHLTTFCGKPVEDFDPETGIKAGIVPRLRLEYEEGTWEALWPAFLADPRVAELEELVIGAWGSELFAGGESSSGPVQSLVESKARLPRLKRLFLGDIVYTESEISWIPQSDVSALWAAYPKLEYFQVRGAEGLSLGKMRLDELRTLIIETGGMSRSVLDEVLAAQLPRLEHLELWLGDSNYGADIGPQDLAPILSGERFPNLTYLGLCNSEITDDLAAALADAPLLEKLETLDLSKGTLGDAGANSLLEFPLISRLKLLDIHHHYVSPPVVEKLKGLGVKLIEHSRQEPSEWGGESHRHIYVAE